MSIVNYFACTIFHTFSSNKTEYKYRKYAIFKISRESPFLFSAAGNKTVRSFLGAPTSAAWDGGMDNVTCAWDDCTNERKSTCSLNN